MFNLIPYLNPRRQCLDYFSGRFPDLWFVLLAYLPNDIRIKADDHQWYLRRLSPLTVAGPQRICTAFPFHPVWAPDFGSILSFLISFVKPYILQLVNC